MAIFQKWGHWVLRHQTCIPNRGNVHTTHGSLCPARELTPCEYVPWCILALFVSRHFCMYQSYRYHQIVLIHIYPGHFFSLTQWPVRFYGDILSAVLWRLPVLHQTSLYFYIYGMWSVWGKVWWKDKIYIYI